MGVESPRLKGPSTAAPGSAPDRAAWGALARSLALVFCGAGVLVWPALYNGYPLLYNDSGGYLRGAFTLEALARRSSGYPLFLFLVGARNTLWAAVLAQALITSGLLVRLCALVFRGPRSAWLAPLGLLLGSALLTEAAKFNAWILADITSAWLVLAGTLWFLSRHRLDRALAALLIALAVASHNTHLALVLAALAALLAALLFGGRRLAAPMRRDLAAFAGVLVASVAASVALHAALGGGVSLSRGGPTFLIGRLHASGVLVETLDRYCAEKRWKACAQRDALALETGVSADWLLWNLEESPLMAMGGWQQAGGEHSEIVEQALRCCLGAIVRSTLVDGWTQFWTVDSADGLSRMAAATGTQAEIARWMPHELGAALVARQLSDRSVAVRLFPSIESAQHGLCVLLALVGSVLAFARRRPAAGLLLAALLGLLLVNALTIGFGSAIHARYTGRLAWLLPGYLALAFGLYRRGASSSGAAEPAAQIAYIGLGSNLGDRQQHLRKALAALAAQPGVELLRVSKIHETAPHEPAPGSAQENYLNAVAELATTLAPRALLAALLAIEAAQGRQRGAQRNEARTLDLDLLLYGAQCIDEPDLEVPHPRLHLRRFVLEPLLELAPALRHPRLGVDLHELAERLR